MVCYAGLPCPSVYHCRPSLVFLAPAGVVLLHFVRQAEAHFFKERNRLPLFALGWSMMAFMRAAMVRREALKHILRPLNKGSGCLFVSKCGVVHGA